MKLSHLELVKLQHLLADIHEDNCLNTGIDLHLSEFDPLSFELVCGDNCLHIASWRSDLEAIKLLVEGGVDINVKGDNGYTALDAALTQNSKEVVSFLIDNGGRVNRKGQIIKWLKDKTE